MVSGFTKFKERFQGFENQYVIIGGTACDLIMENEELPFRATKDGYQRFGWKSSWNWNGAVKNFYESSIQGDLWQSDDWTTGQY